MKQLFAMYDDANQIWPAWRALDTKGKGQAFADAALIARYGK